MHVNFYVKSYSKNSVCFIFFLGVKTTCMWHVYEKLFVKPHERYKLLQQFLIYQR